MQATRYLLTLSVCVVGAASATRDARAQSYSVSQTSAAFSSIAGTGTSLGVTGQDDYTASLSVPFGFPFFGSTVSSGTLLYLSTNGTLNIGSASSSYDNTGFPTSGAPDGFFAPFWMDLTFGAGGEAYYQTVGSELVVEWNGVQNYGGTGETITFQVRIATDGTIRYAYGNTTALGAWNGASVGLEDVSGTVGAGAACSPSCMPLDLSGTVVVFTPGAAPTTPDLAFFDATGPSSTTLTAGASYQVSFEVENLGAATAVASRVALFVGESGPVTTSNGIEIATTSIPSLVAQDSYAGSLTFTVPSGTPVGTLAAAVIVDPDSVVSESSEGNNAFQLGTYSVGGGTGAITITTSELPAATLGIPYDVQLQQIGGTSPTWAVLEGGAPPGLSLSSGGRLSGTPSQAGTFPLAVEAYEDGIDGDIAELVLVVSEGGTGSITVSPSTLPDASVGVAYTANLTAVGGVAPYAFQVISGRPDWMVVSSDGSISGTPTGPGTYSMTVSVFDADFADATAVVGLTVVQAGPLEVVSQIPAGVSGRDYRQTVVRGGLPPYSVAILDGALPSGMVIDPNGILAGVLPSPGRWQITLQVSDAEGSGATGQFTLQATELTELTITSSEIAINLRADVSVPLDVSGGVAPYTWSIVQGALQPGLSLDPEGRIVGQVQDASTVTVTFSVQDADGQSAQREILVVARGYRNSDPGRTSRSGGGCICVEPRGAPGALFGFVALSLLVGVRRRRHSK